MIHLSRGLNDKLEPRMSGAYLVWSLSRNKTLLFNKAYRRFYWFTTLITHNFTLGFNKYFPPYDSAELKTDAPCGLGGGVE